MPGTRRRPRRATAATSRDTPGSKRIDVPDGMSRRKPWAVARSNSRAALLSGRCRCEPIWIGRSPVLTMTRVIRSPSGRSAFRVRVPGATRTLPGRWHAAAGADGVVQRDELAPVRERGLDLNVVDHLGHAVHHLLGRKNGPPRLHELRNRRALPGPLDHPGAQQGDCLGVVEADPPGQPVAGHHAGDGEKQFVRVSGAEVHVASLGRGRDRTGRSLRPWAATVTRRCRRPLPRDRWGRRHCETQAVDAGRLLLSG